MKHLAFLVTMLLLASAAFSGEEPAVQAIKTLQAAHSEARARNWARVFDRAGRETGIDSLLLVAIAHRETSLILGVVGTRGEVGLMQLHGLSLRHRPGRCNPKGVSCSIRAGAAFLQFCRATCGGSWNRWVGAYGLSRCPSEEEAKAMKSVRRARAIYESIGGKKWM